MSNNREEGPPDGGSGKNTPGLPVSESVRLELEALWAELGLPMDGSGDKSITPTPDPGDESESEES